MTLEQRIAKEFLDDLIPRYMSAGLFDGRPEMIFRQTLFCDLVRLVKTARDIKAQTADDYERLVPTAEDCAAFAKGNAGVGKASTPTPKKRTARKTRSSTK